MTQQLSPRDWESLSAYLDRALKPKEIASLEARLSADPVLSAGLGELQRTRNALRSLPLMRAPRNFTLTPQMVGQRSPLRPRPAGRLAPVFGFASALATFILVLVIVGDFMGILAPATKPVAQAPVRTSEVASNTAATAGAEPGAAKQLAPTFTELPQPTMAAAAEAQALEAPQSMTDTAPMSLTVGAVAPLTLSEVTPTLTETLTISAKASVGLGGGMPGEAGDNMLPEDSILTDQGPMWVSTVQVNVSPTETLTFPMTITLEGPSITQTYETAVETELPVEALMQAEPTFTIAPEAPPAAKGPPISAPTATPEVLAQMVETPAASQLEQPALEPTEAPSQATGPPPAGTNRTAVRIIEIALAGLALVSALAALYFWRGKRL